PPSLRAMHEPLSMELSRLLSDAEDRVAAWSYETLPPTPEEELEAVIPEEYLRSLDAPIAALEEDHEVALQNNRTTTAGGHKQTTGGGNSVRATDAPRNAHTSSVPNAATDSRPDTGQESRAPSHHAIPHPSLPSATQTAGLPTIPPMRLQAGLPRPSASPGAAPLATMLQASPESSLESGLLDRSPTLEPSRGTESFPPTFLAGADILAHIARSIVARKTGGICFVTKGSSEVLRRILFRDGDFMVVVSSAVEESLVAFLIERGDLSPEHFDLVHAIPAFGKRAVAPLIARGLVTRDQMWALLRAHAEWILSRTFCLPDVFVVEEAEVPKRILEEDPVFGGSTGAEVFVDVVRRILPPEEATRALGGEGAILRSGPERNLAGELRGPIAHFVEASIGRSLAETNVAEDENTSALVFALAMLGVVEVTVEKNDASAPDLPETDVGALRERIKRRYALVEDGDYFSILGIPRSATAYEIRRAYTELRRAFEPTSILTPETADLQREVKAIVRVLGEAFELLRDDATRKRYRAALESVPGAQA
nr:hypothetical protein [Polyangiaceae bacterium]